jgi:hypothetical protein
MGTLDRDNSNNRRLQELAKQQFFAGIPNPFVIALAFEKLRTIAEYLFEDTLRLDNQVVKVLIFPIEDNAAPIRTVTAPTFEAKRASWQSVFPGPRVPW